ncbi:hypothetical protein V8C44DRAFT_335293 [Trichoderma aethiopicum]
MPNIRQITTCSRCRLLKIRCDKTKPSCERCVRAKVDCSLQADSLAQATESSTSNPPVTKTSIAGKPPSIHSEAIAEEPPSSSDNSAPPPDATTAEHRDAKAIRRRQRALLACTRCHRLKAGCDKQLPCSRCRRSGWARQCTYTHRVEDDSSTSDASPAIGFVTSHEDAKSIYTSWHTRRRGTTHWKALITRLEISALNIGQTFHHAEDTRILHIDCSTDILLPSNFPFNSPGASKYSSSLDRVRNLVYSHRENCDAFVDTYLALYQPVHPILDAPRFLEEINSFWKDSAHTDVSWLSTYLMVLALGCFAVTRDSASTIELCLAAESCLARTAFMVRPSMSVMRTFCLMVLAKQLANGTCWSLDASWSLLGIVVRLAVCIGLHKPPVASSKPLDDHAVTLSEWQSGHMLWITIVYFCIQTAAITGMPSLLSSDDVLQRTEAHNALLSQVQQFGPWLSLSDSFPTICNLIARVNSDTEKPTYDEILQYNADIKRFMAATLEHPGCKNAPLRAVIDIFFRRILLVLHRCHALQPDAPILHPVSYWASLECSLAILVHHRDLCEHVGNPDHRDLLGRLFKMDFFAAALTAGLHLLQTDAPLADGFSIPPRQTIVETLETCTEIWGRDKERSICFRSGHRSLMRILSMLSDLDAMRGGLPIR